VDEIKNPATMPGFLLPTETHARVPQSFQREACYFMTERDVLWARSSTGFGAVSCVVIPLTQHAEANRTDKANGTGRSVFEGRIATSLGRNHYYFSAGKFYCLTLAPFLPLPLYLAPVTVRLRGT